MRNPSHLQIIGNQFSGKDTAPRPLKRWHVLAFCAALGLSLGAPSALGVVVLELTANIRYASTAYIWGWIIPCAVICGAIWHDESAKRR